MSLEWMNAHSRLLLWPAAIGAAMFVVTLAIIPLICIGMPEDYFDDRDRAHSVRSSCHTSPVKLTGLVVKNLLGAFLFVVGTVMLGLPGQGVLTMLAGIVLMDLPGKRAVERSLVRRPLVHRPINWMRAKAGKPPLKIPASRTTASDSCGVPGEKL